MPVKLDFLHFCQRQKWLFIGTLPETLEFLAVACKTLTAKNVLADVTSCNANTRRKCGELYLPHSGSPSIGDHSHYQCGERQEAGGLTRNGL